MSVMEDQLISSSLLTTFFLFLFILSAFAIRKRLKQIGLASNLPPGPWKLPIIGNLHNLVGSLPHHALRDLARKYGPLMHLQLGEVSTVVVSSPDAAREVMKTHDISFASRPQLLALEMLSYNSSNIAFSPYGEYWRQLRKICTLDLLSMKRVQSFWWIRKEETSILVERIASSIGLQVNLSEMVYATSYSIICRAATSKKRKGQEAFKSVLEESLKFASGFIVADVFPSLTWLHGISGTRAKLEDFHHKLDELLENVIIEHRKARGSNTGRAEESEDLVDVLLKFEERDEEEFSLSTSNIKSVILDMIAAGSETSATTIDWATAEMMRNPEILEKAQSEVRKIFRKPGKVVEEELPELKFLNAIIKETLRLHPPIAMLLPRECRENCRVYGFDIPLKTKVIVNAWAIGRDPSHWKDPEKFYPERFLESSIDFKGNNFELVPFGAGRRICPGMNFGVVNVQYQLASLLYHFNWKLPNEMKGRDLDMTESFGLAVKRKYDLYLIPTPYHPFPSN